VQCATGCTLGKGNMEKTPYGKLAMTLIERATNRAVRITYKPTLHKKIGESAFRVKRGQGIEPDEIPESEQMELVDLVWEAQEPLIMSIGEMFQFDRDWMPEIMGFEPCTACHELTARAYLRLVGASMCVSPARAMSAEPGDGAVRFGSPHPTELATELAARPSRRMGRRRRGSGARGAATAPDPGAPPPPVRR
jgi:formylmethanofuran dehydrogenase subunit E